VVAAQARKTARRGYSRHPRTDRRLYFGFPKGRDDVKDGRERAVDTLEYYDYEIRRIMNLAFELAKGRKKKVTSVDKANVLESSRLWRQIASSIGTENPDVELEHTLVDTAAMKLITGPAWMDVVVTENMFGDILTDEASVLAGSMGMLPSASLGEAGSKSGSEARMGLYEPIHGSAPDIAGKGIANPIGTILSAAMMLRHSFNLETEAAAIEKAVDETITAGARTADIGGKLNTRQMAEESSIICRDTAPLCPYANKGELSYGHGIEVYLEEWRDGAVRTGDLHFLTPALHYGAAVFEGIRAYNTPKGPAVFRLREHVERLLDSARVLGFREFPWDVDDLVKAHKDTVRVNGFADCYIRPLDLFGRRRVEFERGLWQTVPDDRCLGVEQLSGR
jgi:hypothetical protein